MAISKIILNGVTQMDVTDTTAVAADVASGKYFHTADGISTEGTSAGTSHVETVTVSNSSATNTSINFTNLKGRPKWFFVRCTTQLTRSSSSSYYYIVSMRYNGTNTNGNYWRMSNGTFYNDTTHYSFSYSGTTLTVSSSASRSSAGGSFYNGNYELTYIY